MLMTRRILSWRIRSARLVGPRACVQDRGRLYGSYKISDWTVSIANTYCVLQSACHRIGLSFFGEDISQRLWGKS